MPIRTLTRRVLLKSTASAALASTLASCLNPASTQPARTLMKTFDPLDYGARADGTTLDSPAIQRAIDAAAATASPTQRARIILPGNRTYLIGTLQLRSHLEFHLEEGARLLVSTNRADYHVGDPVVAEGYDGGEAALVAHDAENIRVTGPGTIDGRSLEFMDYYDTPNEWWIFKPFRPRLVVFTGCSDIEFHDVHLVEAPIWTLHLIGCRHALIDSITIKNQLDVPNCDGIDPDHCSDVEIKNCDITCGDDAIVLKTTRQTRDFGPCTNIRVKDCRILTQDAGLKIGTETTSDITDCVFERCHITSSSRGIGIQLRDAGNVSNITFRDITLTSRYHSDPWWGRGEAISLTALPRTAAQTASSSPIPSARANGGPQSQPTSRAPQPAPTLGTLSNIHFQNITATSENSARILGSALSRPKNITFDNLTLTLNRWTKYAGPIYDNRPTSQTPALEPHPTPAINLRHADAVTLNRTTVAWGDPTGKATNLPDYFTHALESQDTTNLNNTNFIGTAAHPQRDPPIALS